MPVHPSPGPSFSGLDRGCPRTVDTSWTQALRAIGWGYFIASILICLGVFFAAINAEVIEFAPRTFEPETVRTTSWLGIVAAIGILAQGVTIAGLLHVVAGMAEDLTGIRISARRLSEVENG
jgi:hypothetical protein